MINTALGTISASEMGTTLVHEHCFVEADVWAEKPANIEERYAKLWDEPLTIANMGLVARAGMYSPDNMILIEPYQRLQELNAFRAAGGKTVVDCTVDGLGREKHFRGLPMLSKRSGVNIIPATGYYVEATHPANVKHQAAEELAEGMVNDITNSIHGSNMKAGVIKLAVSENKFTDQEKKALKAGSIAQKKTNVPLTVHTWGDEPGKWNGFEVIDLLKKYDVDFKKVYMSHVDWTVSQEENWGTAVKAAATGVYISFDNFGNEWPYWSQDHSSERFNYISAPTDLDRLRGIKRLIDAGYENQVLMSHDLGQKLRLKAYGGHGLDHIQTNVFNLFKYLKMDQSLFQKITVENPARLFG
jgi:phosphotriesterase-related protein